MENERLPRKLVAVLYADVAGYSRATATDEDDSHRTLSDYLDLIASTIVGQHGQLMHYAGDAALARFEAAVDALACAQRIQAEIGRRNDLLPEARRIVFRIGLNLGDVILDRGDMYGNGVNVAARMQALAAPGGIAFSESFQAALRGQPDVRSLRIGRRRVKNIADPIGIYTLADDPTASEWRRTRRSRAMALAAGAVITVFIVVAAWRGGWLDWSQPQPVPDHSVAVLPFENLSGRTEDAYLSEGFSDELRDQLSQVDGIRVVARTSSITFKNSNQDTTRIARTLGVATVVEGGLRKEDDRVRISVRLVDGAKGEQVWSQSYNRTLGDMLAMQQEIALDAARQILPQLSPAAVPAPQWQASVHELMLLARSYQQNAFAPRDQDKVIAIYRQVLEADSESAPAHARLGKALLLQGQDLEAAERHVRRALALDPQLAEAHAIMGLLLWSQFREGAGAEYQRAVELNPNDADSAHYYSEYLRLQNQGEQGWIYLRRAVDLDPMSLWHNADVAYYTSVGGDIPGAEQAMAVIEQRFPNAAGRHVLSRIANAAGKLDEAIAWSLEALRLDPQQAEATQDLAQLYSRLGLIDASRRFQAEPELAVLFWERRYADIIERMLHQDPSEADTDDLGYLAFALQATGRDAEAILVLYEMDLPDVALDGELRRFAAMHHLATLISALQASGSTQEAQRLAAWLERFASPDEVHDQPKPERGWGMRRLRACALAVQGKHEQAIVVFDEAARAPNLAWLPYLQDSGCFRSLQGGPRYRAAIKTLEARHAAIRARLPETLAEHGFAPDGIELKDPATAPVPVTVQQPGA